jgi:hypothetical protein
VGAKNFIQVLSNHSDLTRLDVVKRYLCVLMVFAIVGAFGSIFYHKRQESSWLFTSSTFIHRLHLLHGLIQRRYVLKQYSTVKGSKKSLKQFSARNLELLACPLNSHWSIFFDGVKHSPYIAFFASLPLRSPPLFS